MGEGDGVARTERDVVEGAAVFAQSDFAVGASIEIIEDCFGQAPLGKGAEVADVDDGRREHEE